MSFWENILWANILLGKPHMSKFLWANVSGQMLYGQMSWNHLIHVANLPDCLGVVEESNSGYADDTGVWATGSSVNEVMGKLQTLANRFTAYMKGNGLALNAAKTQLLIKENKSTAGLEIIVAACVVKPSDTLEQLGVKFDRSLQMHPQIEQMAPDAKHRVAYIA
jgi:hypothetical protein